MRASGWFRRRSRQRGQPLAAWGWMAATVAVVAAAVAGSAWWLLGVVDADPGRVNAIRGALTAGAAAGGGMGLLLAFRRQQYHETDATEQRITGRYTAAVDQLGSDKTDVRIGGIYALERLAADSPADHPTIIEVLCAFVREHTRPEGRDDAPSGSGPDPVLASWMAVPTPPTAPVDRRVLARSADVQAALTVLGRRTIDYDTRPIDLAGTNLTGAYLRGANLTSAYLAEADLTDANLIRANLGDANLADANLTDANLIDANLTGAYLRGANLTSAYLAEANLTEANLNRVNLNRVNLIRANLTGASLIRANLTGASLTRANLTGADLTRANLAEADLTEANLIDADLTGANLIDANLIDAKIDHATLARAVVDSTVRGLAHPPPEEGLGNAAGP